MGQAVFAWGIVSRFAKPSQGSIPFFRTQAKLLGQRCDTFMPRGTGVAALVSFGR